MTAILEARDLVVVRGAREIVRVPALSIEEGEALAILGPNGAGKTTLLLALARLLAASGELRFRGTPVQDELAYRRSVAVVFQRPLLLDRSVRDNAELGLALRGIPAADRSHRAADALARLGIGHLGSRRARGLSGGEAQRLSIARALALDPAVLFLDEPFAALDAPTRGSLMADLSRVVGDRRLTTVLVTHHRDEARSLADRIAVMLDGSIRQLGTVEGVFAAPADHDVGAFLGLSDRTETVEDRLSTPRLARK